MVPSVSLAEEVLAESIRQDANIVGIDIAGTACKVSQYADDTTLFLRDDASLYSLAELLAAYQTATGPWSTPLNVAGFGSAPTVIGRIRRWAIHGLRRR